MSKPKMFIGSSQKNLKVAKLLAEGLEECVDSTTWDEDVFGLNQGFLETLLINLDEYDFAAFIFAPDDVTTSKDETKPSTRDNVLFESGLFMGVLGRARVFLVYEESSGLRIPSDLAGVTLASYDGSLIEGTNPLAAVRNACRRISENIKDSRFPHLVGEWQSMYPMTAEEENPTADEVVEIRAWRDGISIISKISVKNDYYQAFGRFPEERQIIGKWKSREQDSDACGVFMLTVHPNSTYMYGYFTSPDEAGGITYASWILAKKADADEAKVSERLKRAQNMLTKTTIGLPPQTSGS